MNIIRAIITSLVVFLFSSTLVSASQDSKPITMTLPDTVLNEVIQKALPMDVPIQSNTILGSVSIDAIKDLQIKKDTISSHITLSGHKLNLVTSIAGHDLRMKIGSLTMRFQCDATIRFDAKKQTLFFKPAISELHSSDKAKTEVASLIAQLFNNREFPLQLDKTKPITADTGNSILNLSMRINSINLQPDTIQLQLTPQIAVKPKAKTPNLEP